MTTLADSLRNESLKTDALNEKGERAYTLSHLDDMVRWLYMSNTERANIIAARRENSNYSPFDTLRTDMSREIAREIKASAGNNASLALYGRFLAFLRDPRKGIGMRSLYRAVLADTLTENVDLNLLVEYGRWDDLIAIEDATENEALKIRIHEFVRATLHNDDSKADLLCKWMPSENTHSKTTRRLARKWMNILHMTPKAYRKRLALGRKHMDIAEHHLHGEAVHTANYETMPSNALSRYGTFFSLKDEDRFGAYVKAVCEGKAKAHTAAQNLVELYNEGKRGDSVVKSLATVRFNELMKDAAHGEVLVAIDLSCSMESYVTNKVTSRDIAESVGYFMSRTNDGEYKNLAIAFADSAEILDFSECQTIEQVYSLYRNTDVGCCTRVDKVFECLLNHILRNNLNREDVPRILIVTDCEFDDCDYYQSNRTIMEKMQRLYAEHGVKFPKLIFWNTQNRSNTIPMCEDEKTGVMFLSGFSQNVLDMVTDDTETPKTMLVRSLLNPHWDAAKGFFMH